MTPRALAMPSPRFMGYLAGCGQKSDTPAPRHGLRHRYGSFTGEEFGPNRLTRLKSKEIHAGSATC